jgi:hypothetical protein
MICEIDATTDEGDEVDLAAAHREKTSREPDTPHVQGKRSIPTDATGRHFANDLAQYLDRLLDEALEETFPASDALAVPSQRELEKR